MGARASSRYRIREVQGLYLVIDSKYGVIVERCATRTEATIKVNELSDAL